MQRSGKGMAIEDLLLKKVKKSKSRALDLNAELEKQLKAAGIPYQREVEFKTDESSTWIYHKLKGDKWKWDRTEKPRKWKVDFLVDDSLVVEVDGSTYGGGGHTRGAPLENQYVRDRMLQRWGYEVMRVTRNMILAEVAINLIMGEASNENRST